MLTYNPFEKLRPAEPEKNEKKEKQHVFKSLLDDFEAAKNAILEVERAGYPQAMAEQRNIAHMEGEIRGAAYELKRQIEGLKKQGVAEKEYFRSAGSGFEGLFGGNRYGVRGDGTICLSASHSFGECIKKAKEVGIAVKDVHDREAWSMLCPCGSGEIYGHCHGR